MNKVTVMAMISTKVTTCTLVMPLAKPALRKVSRDPSAEDRLPG
jgi:hypothetical protein